MFLKDLNPKIKEAWKKFKLGEPTEIQKLAFKPIYAGLNTLLISPTGTGKTLAALVPILEKWLKEKPKPISILYISPMKALNRDQLEHLIHWGKALELEVTVRHGDTSMYERKLQTEFPNDMMIVTLETLQPILVGKKIREHLRNVKWVILDEVHEIYDSKRGVQLTLALERLRQLCGDFQLIMLSATVGKPEEVAKFFSGGRLVKTIVAKPKKSMVIHVIQPKTTSKDRLIAEKIFSSVQTAARVRTIIELIKQSRSTLVFTNTREFAEILTSRIKTIDKKLPIAIHHSSLSKQVRIKAEKEFKQEKLKSLICTSSLQLGVDIGSVDQVLQYQSPREVTQLVQRVGRSGHGITRTSKGEIITTDEDDIFESAIIARKALAGELEEPIFHRKSYDVLAHQIVGLTFDFGKVPLEKAYNIVKKAYPYRDLTYKEFLDVCKLLERIGLIFLNGWIKKRRRAFKYYFSQLSTIPDTKQYRVFNLIDSSFVGVLDEEFVALHGKPNTTFILKGEPYKIISVEGRKVLVEPSSDITAAIPGWEGELIPVPFEVAQEVGWLRGKIANGANVEWIKENYPVDGEAAKKMVKIIKKQKKFAVPTDKKIVIESWENFTIIHACFGSKVNEALGRFISELLSTRVGSIALKTDPYRIIIQSQGRILEIVKEILTKTDPEYLKPYIELGLTKGELFNWKFIHVAKRFGVISRDAEFGKYTMKKIIDEYVGTPVYKETLKELETDKLDIYRASKLLRQIQKGGIDLVFTSGLSPLGRLGMTHKFSEIIMSEKPKEIFKTFKKRLLNTRVKLVCMNCGEWSETFKVKDIKDSTRCRRCKAKLLTIVKPENTRAQKLIKKSLQGKKLTKNEKEYLLKLRQIADLFLVYGKKAAIVLAGKGIGPMTARRLLAKYYKNEDELIQLTLEAERQFFRTRRYWSV